MAKVWKRTAPKILVDKERGMRKPINQAFEEYHRTGLLTDKAKMVKQLLRVDAFLAACDEEREEMSPMLRKLLDAISGKV